MTGEIEAARTAPSVSPIKALHSSKSVEWYTPARYTYDVVVMSNGSRATRTELGRIVIDAHDAEAAARLAVEEIAAGWLDQDLWPPAVNVDVTPREPETREFVVTRRRTWTHEATEVGR